MANPSTTHVIEIETGIGEPAFIPLSMGQELQPISVGKKGMWRIESPRVLDVHAFVYFDGNSLFLQSADENSAASVDGFRVGKAWTELHAPCMIDIGSARLRYRSLIADVDNQPTQMAAGPPVPAPPGGPGSRPGASMPVAGAPQPPGQAQRMATGQRPGVRPPTGLNPQVAFPKAERPFRPGEFSGAPDVDENTRFAPLDASGVGVASGSYPRPDEGGRSATVANPAMQGAGQFGATGTGIAQQPGMMHQGGYDLNQPQGYAPQGYANSGGSGSFAAPGAMGHSGMPPIPGPPGMPQGQLGGSYGSMTPQGVQQPPPPAKDLVAKLKANPIPKMVAGLLLIAGGVLYYLAEDAPPKKPVAALDAGGMGTTAGGSAPALVSTPVMPQNTVPVAPTWPAGVPCPPPNWPPSTPLPCTPNSAGQTEPPVPGGRDAGGGKPPRDPKDAGVSQSSSGKTLARQAVDFVAAGETAKAAAAYEELLRREPDNKVYGEAARILRAKLDAGAP